MAMTLTFLGAAGTVTGSKYLLRDADGDSVLFDCGLFQGEKRLRMMNWDRFPVDQHRVSEVVITHAHVDHTGYLPKLVREGFRGPVYGTPATCDLMRLLLRDSAHMLEEEARYANKKGYSRHKPALPLYTAEDAERALSLLRPVPYDQRQAVPNGWSIRFRPIGHILGASFVVAEGDGLKVLFSGDVGRRGDPIMKPPEPVREAVDYLLCESTYGTRSHEQEPVEENLAKELKPALDRGGVVVVPAFAVGRSTLLLHYLKKLEDAGRIPKVPVYLDSPMAVSATELYIRYQNEHGMRPVEVECAMFRCSRTVDESKAINAVKGPAVILSGSGMATGGRVLHHLAHRLPDPRNLVLLVGYQSPGTRGWLMLNGARDVKIHGQRVPVRARVATVHGMSAHADADGLIEWLRTVEGKPRKAVFVHGEPDGLDAMRRRVEAELGWHAHVPSHGESLALV